MLSLDEWPLHGLRDPGPPNDVWYRSVRIREDSFCSTEDADEDRSTDHSVRPAVWTKKVRIVRIGLSMGSRFVEAAERIATMFPKVDTLVADCGYLSDELAALRRFILAAGPRMRRFAGASLRPLLCDPEVRRACPWAGCWRVEEVSFSSNGDRCR